MIVTRSIHGRTVYPLIEITVCPSGCAQTLDWDQPGHQSARYRLRSRDPVLAETLWSGVTLQRERVIEPIRTMPVRYGLRSGEHGYQIPRQTPVLVTVSPPGDRAPDCHAFAPTHVDTPPDDDTYRHWWGVDSKVRDRQRRRYALYVRRLAAYHNQR